MSRLGPASPLALALLLALGAAACGSSSVSGPIEPPPGQLQPPVVTIREGGVDPRILHMFTSRTVTFINADTRPRAIFSDTHPSHATCGGILNMGTLAPGEQRVIPDLPPNACVYHDEAAPEDQRFVGVLVVH